MSKYVYSKPKSDKKVQAIKQPVQDLLGYDLRLIVGDLKMTLFVSVLLIFCLVFLAWYLPFGVLSS